MDSERSKPTRRNLLRAGGAAALASCLLDKVGVAASSSADSSPRGLPPLKITDVRIIVTCPDRNYVLVKISTSEPGLYGVGDATLNGRELAVAADLEQHIAPLLMGRDPEQIEDTWQYLYRGPYWRGGPVQMTALAGVDLALWDIKGKRAGMPVYQLLGGRTRTGALCYTHASGRDFAQVEDQVRRAIERGFKCVRAQVAIPGLEETYGTPGNKKPEETAGRVAQMAGLPSTEIFEPAPYLRTVPRLFEHLRAKLGDEVELLHDVHEKLDPIGASQLARSLEPYHLFFLEDPLRPEYKESFRLIRQHSTTPIAMGELFNSLWDCVPLIKEQWIDYIRCDLDHIGGITAARKVATLAELFQVKTAWHGPGDIGPPTHAANVHVDISIPNFGIQEMVFFPDVAREVMPGGPEFKDGAMHVSDTPGLGTDVNEEAAKKYPYRRAYLPTARRQDGSVQDW
ncbi:MAG TPA: D-mannonate dehydratase ManD [Terriglobia bacterium]|nr:D-mannonate dehydratase ManD [Terriglobia bacterium]